MTPMTVTIWLAYYSDGSEVTVFGSELEALRYAVDGAMEVKSQDVDVVFGVSRSDSRRAFKDAIKGEPV